MLGPVLNRVWSLGNYVKQTVHNVSALCFFVNPNGISPHVKTYQNDRSSYYDAMKGTI